MSEPYKVFDRVLFSEYAWGQMHNWDNEAQEFMVKYEFSGAFIKAIHHPDRDEYFLRGSTFTWSHRELIPFKPSVEPVKLDEDLFIL